MSPTKSLLQELLPACEQIALKAGEAIMQVYQSDFAVTHKEDKSPVTEADLAADRVIETGLKELTPDWPILSEESATIPFEIRRQWSTYWLIDPLDGTREFVKRNGEFTVNIALVHEHEVVLGVVHAPVPGKTWSAARGLGASYFSTEPSSRKQIQASELDMENLTVMISRSHASEKVKTFLKSIKPRQTISSGSSIKLCMVAAGEADLYARLGLTSEWDTAAAQCVVEEAGGHLTDTQMKPLRYNTKDSLLNPEFFVFGKTWYDWSLHL